MAGAVAEPIRVKICGTTREDDARAAADLGAWAIGMILSSVGPRALGLAEAARIRRAIPPGVLAVGVFVDEPAAKVSGIARTLGLDLVQLHGDEPPEVLGEIPLGVLKAFAVDTIRRHAPDAAHLGRYRAAFGALLDGRAGAAAGGTGRAFDWSLLDDPPLRAAVPGGRLVLAGGLSPSNVGEAISRARPWAVDVSSGVESAPGVKDRAALSAFFAAAQRPA